MPSPAPARGAFLVVCLAYAVLLGYRETSSWDFFWHLSNGRATLQAHAIQRVDSYSFSAAGQPLHYQDLAADLIFYAGFSRLGYAFFALLKGAAALGVALALYAAPPPGRRQPLAAVLGAGLVLVATQFRFMERPLLFSEALFPLLLCQMEALRRDAADPDGPHPRVFLAVLLTQWLWIQLHREALVGLALLWGQALYLAMVALARRVPALARLAPVLGPGPTRRGLIAGVGLPLVAVALCLVNPGGAATLTSSFDLAGSAIYRQLIVEWQTLPPGALILGNPIDAALCLGALAGLLVRLGVALRRREAAAPVSLWHLGCWLLFAERSLRSVRWLPVLDLSAALILALLLPELVTALLRRLPGPRRAATVLVLAAGASCGLGLVWHDARRLRLGEMADHYPSGALAFARAQGLGERVVNSSEFGGYIMWAAWPRFKVLVDGRIEMLYTPRFVRHCFEGEVLPARFAKMRQADQVDWVLGSNMTAASTYAFLAHDPAWALVYYSEAASVYVRRDRYPQLLPLALPHIDPAHPLAGLARAAQEAAADPRVLAQVEGELARLRAASPSGVMTTAMQAFFYHKLGAHEDARDGYVRQLLAQHPQDGITRQVLRFLREP